MLPANVSRMSSATNDAAITLPGDAMMGDASDELDMVTGYQALQTPEKCRQGCELRSAAG